MEHRTLEITLQHAKNLGKVKYFGKMAVYAVVSISDEHDELNDVIKQSPVDHNGDTRPTWNFPIKFKVGEEALQGDSLTLRFNLLCQRYYGDVDVGGAEISIKKLLNGPVTAAATADGWRSMRISVINVRGERHGQLSFSYKFSGGTIPPPPPLPSSSSDPPPPPPSQGTDWTKILTGITNATEKIVVCVVNGVVELGEIFIIYGCISNIVNLIFKYIIIYLY